MSRDAERIIKMFNPDGYEEGTPYWVLPNDRITYNYKRSERKKKCRKGK